MINNFMYFKKSGFDIRDVKSVQERDSIAADHPRYLDSIPNLYIGIKGLAEPLCFHKTTAREFFEYVEKNEIK